MVPSRESRSGLPAAGRHPLLAAAGSPGLAGDRVVGQLDPSGFIAAYRADRQGQAPYDPAMMLALVFYCYFKGIRSSRNIKRACVDDVGCCGVICGGAMPSHRAVAEFLRRHRGEVRRLFVQVLGLLVAEGAVEGRCVAVDGSPVSGNA